MTKEKAKRGRGRPRYEPTEDHRRMVQVMVGTGVPHETIARNVGPDGIGVVTLRKYFAEELQFGREQLVASVKALLVKAAQNGSVRAQLAILERLGGPEWAPRQYIGGIADAPPIALGGNVAVTVYLPDNGRDRAEDHHTDADRDEGDPTA